MYFRTPIAAMLACVMMAPAGHAETFDVGMKELNIIEESGERHLSGFLWYPTQDDTPAITAHGNAVWESIHVIPDARTDTKPRPLVVLSHGMFGNARNQAWLAADLVENGYVVAAIDHPGTTTFQRDPVQRRQLWRRSEDISRVIDHLTSGTQDAPHVDTSRIFVAGHSLGGFSAALLAGARFEPDRLATFCASQSSELVCDIFSAWEVAQSPEDRVAMSADLSDHRIRGFALLDLGGTQNFSHESLAALTRPMLVIGAPQDVHGLNLDIESRALVAALPEETVQYIEPEGLAHFDFLGVCTENALAILKDEAPDDVFVCQEGREERRAEHAKISDAVMRFFEGI